MGDGARDALREYIRAGMPYRFPKGSHPKQPRTHSCPHCERVLCGLEGLRAHLKAKHSIRTRPSGEYK